MLINDYTAYKIWESKQLEITLKLSRTVYGLKRRRSPAQLGPWNSLATMLASLIK